MEDPKQELGSYPLGILIKFEVRSRISMRVFMKSVLIAQNILPQYQIICQMGYLKFQ